MRILKTTLFTITLTFLTGCTVQPNQPIVAPEIVEQYTCTDNCDGDRSQYLVKTYADVNSQEQCTQLKGEYVQTESANYCKVLEQ